MRSYVILLFVLSPLMSFAQPNTEVFLFDLNSDQGAFKISKVENISNNEGYDNQPSFIDDQTILFSSTRNGQTDIVKYDLHYGSKTWICYTEGSEYSPLKIPNQNAVSAIRLDPDGTQRLYRYDLQLITNKVLVEDLIVGYHAWIGEDYLVSAVLENDGLSLYSSNLHSYENKRIATSVGRSLQYIPNTKFISFISKKSVGASDIKSYNSLNGKIKTIAKALPDSEDLYWLTEDSILMTKGDAVYRLNISKNTGWIKVASLKDFGITNLTRLAISPNGKKSAIVGELIGKSIINPTPLEQNTVPTLEQVKWISGDWKGEAFGGQTEENWSEPSGGSMMATFKLIDKDTVVFYEIIIIREIENTLILQLKHFGNDLKGWEEKDETIDFPLLEITPDTVSFEGMTFEKVSDHEMNVYVDIKQDDGSTENVKFTYKK